MRFQLQEEIDAFAMKVMELVTPKYGNHWRDRVGKLWADVQERGFESKTPATKKLYMSKFRKGIRDALETAEKDETRRSKVDGDLMEILRIDPMIATKLKEDYEAKLNGQTSNLVVVSEWKQIVKTARLMLKSDDMMDRAIGIMMLTGRRFGEVLQWGHLAPSVERKNGGVVRHRWLVDFSGQSKTKNMPGSMAGKTFPIPTLAPADEIIEAFNGMRASVQGKIWVNATKTQIERTFNGQFNTYLNNCPLALYWPQNGPYEARLIVSNLRTLYAEIAYESFSPTTTRDHYFSRILGHSVEDLNTAVSYMKFSLSSQALGQGQKEMNRLTMLREQRRDAAIAAGNGEQDGDQIGPDETGSDDDLIED